MNQHMLRASLLLLSLLLASCAAPPTNTRDYGAFPRAIPVEPLRPVNTVLFQRDASARRDSLGQPGAMLRGFVTDNRTFLDSVMMPLLVPRRGQFLKQNPVSALNDIALFVHELYRSYFGPGFYRWGGDLLDLDDPQESGSGFAKRFGLDCSGFASAPYELAVLLGVLQPGDSGAVFSSAGFAAHAESLGLQDLGGRNGGANRFRVDTHDFGRLGRAVLSVPKGSSPSAADVARLQPGDVVWKRGHVGLIVSIEGEIFYLESGGSVLPKNGNVPYRAGPALEIFAKGGDLTVRRALPAGMASGRE